MGLIQRLFGHKRESEPRRRRFPRIDDDLEILKRPAKVQFACDTCDRRTTDPPELCVITNKVTGEKAYHVRCPKCWKATGFFRTEAEALYAWDQHDRFIIKED